MAGACILVVVAGAVIQSSILAAGASIQFFLYIYCQAMGQCCWTAYLCLLLFTFLVRALGEPGVEERVGGARAVRAGAGAGAAATVAAA